MIAIISPQNEDEIVEIVRAARANKRSFEIVGHGTKRNFGRLTEADTLLDLSALSGITSYEPDELVIVARAATPIAEIEEEIAKRNQRLGFGPVDWGGLFGAGSRGATVAGVFSTDSCGPSRLRFGPARDHLLGYHAVNGFGEAYRAGGQVVKNVTGFDLPKLVCGAFGTLGVLTEVTLRLMPHAPETATLILRDIDAASGLSLLRQVWASPLEPTGLAFVPQTAAQTFPALAGTGRGAALMRVEGAPAPLADKIAALKALFEDRGAEILADGSSVFAGLGAGSPFVGRERDLWRIRVPPAAAEVFVREWAPDYWLADGAGGLLWMEADAGEADRLHRLAATAGGYATLLKASAESRARVAVFPPEPPIRAALTKRVKAAFDPLGLFNPGRMFETV